MLSYLVLNLAHYMQQNNNQLLTFPGIYSINFKKYMPKSVSTSEGRFDQEHSDLESSKSVGDHPELILFDDDKAKT